jgi:hypothetical protein
MHPASTRPPKGDCGTPDSVRLAAGCRWAGVAKAIGGCEVEKCTARLSAQPTCG